MGKAPVPVYKQFSDNAKIEITNLVEEGKTHDEIGAYFGVAGRTIAKLCTHLGKKE